MTVTLLTVTTLVTMSNFTKLVEDNLQLVRIIAHKHKKRFPYFQIDELVAAGNLGLVQAARDYDCAISSFVTFASLRIAGAMMDMERELRWGKIHKRQRVLDVNDYDIPHEINSHFYEELTEPLDETSKKVFIWYYRDNYTCKEIAAKIGSGESWVSQLLSKSRSKIREKV